MTTDATTDNPTDFERFRACRKAEDYFRFFGLPYDLRVLNTNRLRILCHFAGQLERLHASRTEPLAPERILADYRGALQRSYQTFTTGSVADPRVFKALQDAELEPTA
ncbi:MAG: nitrogenase-stabilizing/protective protein NifW [Mycobacterium sp.]|nr:nitrogenase-stabilizing/protective protein NifW [Mycobacterium sp.]